MDVVDVSNLDMVFGTNAMELLPPWSSIPDEFKRGRTKWNKLFRDWFYGGITSLDGFIPKPGIDKNAALRMIQACMGSWEPKHEHKEAGVAYMFSEFFSDATWERALKQ